MPQSREYFKTLLDEENEWFCEHMRSPSGKVEDGDIEVLKRMTQELMVAGEPLSPAHMFRALEGFAYRKEVNSVFWGWLHLGVVDADLNFNFILGPRGLEIANKQQ